MKRVPMNADQAQMFMQVITDAERDGFDNVTADVWPDGMVIEATGPDGSQHGMAVNPAGSVTDVY